jgi:hypothetical protein
VAWFNRGVVQPTVYCHLTDEWNHDRRRNAKILAVSLSDKSDLLDRIVTEDARLLVDIASHSLPDGLVCALHLQMDEQRRKSSVDGSVPWLILAYLLLAWWLDQLGGECGRERRRQRIMWTNLAAPLVRH